jgi:hypothetical protein
VGGRVGVEMGVRGMLGWLYCATLVYGCLSRLLC